MPEQAPGDFRYETGEADVPWAAVGEHLFNQDLMRIIRFLARPREDRCDEYEEQIAEV